jgi:hypothetical protein
MRTLLAILVVVYLVGIGVVLAPIVKANWNTAPASQFLASVAKEMHRRSLGRRLYIAAQWSAANTASARLEGTNNVRSNFSYLNTRVVRLGILHGVGLDTRRMGDEPAVRVHEMVD